MSLLKGNKPVKKVCYICNEKKPECKMGCKSKGGYCLHTFDSRYALNGPCKDPENHPERFETFEFKEVDDLRPHEMIYVERIDK